MSDSPLLICSRCCSLDIEGAEQPEDDDMMLCRSCGHHVPYRELRAEIELALRYAVLQIHQRVAKKLAATDSSLATL